MLSHLIYYDYEILNGYLVSGTVTFTFRLLNVINQRTETGVSRSVLRLTFLHNGQLWIYDLITPLLTQLTQHLSSWQRLAPILKAMCLRAWAMTKQAKNYSKISPVLWEVLQFFPLVNFSVRNTEVRESEVTESERSGGDIQSRLTFRVYLRKSQVTSTI